MADTPLLDSGLLNYSGHEVLHVRRLHEDTEVGHHEQLHARRKAQRGDDGRLVGEAIGGGGYKVSHRLNIFHHIDFRAGPDGAEEVPLVEVRVLVEAPYVAHERHTVAHADTDLVVPVLAATDIGVCYTERVVSGGIGVVRQIDEGSVVLMVSPAETQSRVERCSLYPVRAEADTQDGG